MKARMTGIGSVGSGRKTSFNGCQASREDLTPLFLAGIKEIQKMINKTVGQDG
jgi:hypothetical protein